MTLWKPLPGAGTGPLRGAEVGGAPFAITLAGGLKKTCGISESRSAVGGGCQRTGSFVLWSCQASPLGFASEKLWPPNHAKRTWPATGRRTAEQQQRGSICIANSVRAGKMLRTRRWEETAESHG